MGIITNQNLFSADTERLDGQSPAADDKYDYNEGFKNGLLTTWEAAVTIIRMDFTVRETVFGFASLKDIVAELSVEEILARLRAYNDKREIKSKIRPGNEVFTYTGKRAVVLSVGYDGDEAMVLYGSGNIADCDIETLTKTGRDFPEIVEVMEKMQEASCQ